MKRLFWKLFAWFWLASLVVSAGIGWGVKFYMDIAHPLTEQLPQTQVAAVALAFEQGDSQKARQLLIQLSQQNRYPIWVLNEQGRDILQRPLPPMIRHLQRRNNLDHRHIISKKVTLPTGHQLTVLAPGKIPPGKIGHPPLWLAIVIALLLSGLVCWWLARYLTAPVARLSQATHQIKGGNLATRVGLTGRRKDELTDLAEDFDAMASQLQSLVEGRQQLLQDISHELRSPLARLQVALALARKEFDSPTLDPIERDLKRLEELVSQVLTLSRLQYKSDPQHWQPFDLSELLSNLVEDCKIEADNRPCSMETAIQPNLTMVGNEELIRRALENLVRNAIKYTHQGSQIEITLAKSPEGINFTLEDNGPGIPESDLQRIFEPFVRLDSARSSDSGGYGLGLAIAKKAIEVHGGTLLAKARSQGAGLCFSAHIPTELT